MDTQPFNGGHNNMPVEIVWAQDLIKAARSLCEGMTREQAEHSEYVAGICQVLRDTQWDWNPRECGIEKDEDAMRALIFPEHYPNFFQPRLVTGRLGHPYYVGPLDKAYAHITTDMYYVHEWQDETGAWNVWFCSGEAPHSHTDCRWVDVTWNAPTYEHAWRYALGAEFGPLDPDYDDDALRAALGVPR